MLDSFFRSVTKDSFGPVSLQSDRFANPLVLHKFHDAFSVMGWGKMPDVLSQRGAINAAVFSHFNRLVKNETAWKEFLRSPDALTFRKAAASIPQSGNVGSTLNDLAEKFPIRTNYLGLVDESVFKNLHAQQKIQLNDFEPNATQMTYPVCEFFAEEKIPNAQVMGRAVWDYGVWRKQKGLRPLPFEFVCHFRLTERSVSALDQRSLVLPKTASVATLKPSAEFDFPLVELVLSQDPFQRRIDFSQAIWMTEISPFDLQRMILTAAWVASFVRYQSTKAKLVLNSTNLRFAVGDPSQPNEFILNDSLSMDDLHFDQLHTDVALDFYEKSSWHQSVLHFKTQALHSGLPEWKRLCVEPAPWLDPKMKTLLEANARQIAVQLGIGA